MIRASTRQPALIAIFIDGLALHEFHDKVGIALIRRSAVEQAGDVLVFKSGQNLAFSAEALVAGLRVQALPHQFYSYLLFVFVVRPNRAVYIAHSSFAQLVQDAVLRDSRADHLVASLALLSPQILGQTAGYNLQSRRFEDLFRTLRVLQQ